MATIAVGAGSRAARSKPIASPQCRSRSGRAATPSSAGARPRSISIAWTCVDPRRQPLGQHPLPGADLEHDVVGLERRVADDRVEQVRVGEEVLAQPDHGRHQPKSAARVRLDRPLELLVAFAAHLGDHLGGRDDVGGLVGLPRTGCGAR